MKTRKHIAFVSIGQTPSLAVDEMVIPICQQNIGKEIEISQFGVLDGLEGENLDAMRAKEGEASFSARLSNKQEIVISQAKTEAKLNQMLAEIDKGNFDLIILLCTGTNIEVKISTLMVEAQKMVDGTIEALAGSAQNIGMILPLERQLAEFASKHDFSFTPKLAAISPYSDEGLAEKLQSLQSCDLVIMHCMGYSIEMHDKVRAVLNCPVLLARQMVASVAAQLI